MANHNSKPNPQESTTSDNFLIDEDDGQETVIRILQVVDLVNYVIDDDLRNLGLDARLGLKRILDSVNQALWYEIHRLAPQE